MYGQVNGSRDRNRVSVLLVAILLCLFLVVGMLVGSVFSDTVRNVISSLLRGQERPVVTITPSILGKASEETSGNQLDRLSEQLVERVKDLSSHLQSVISLFIVIVTLLAVGLGVSIWKTEKHARRLIDSHWATVKKQDVEPLFVDRRKELEDVRVASIVSLLEANSMMWDFISREIKELDESRIASMTLTDEEKGNLLAENAKKRKAQYLMAHFSICVTSKKEDLVVNAAQQLRAKGDSSALLYLEKALDHWPSGSKARSEIQRAIDEIKRRSKESG